MEHCFKHHSDLEWIKLAADNNRKLQYYCKQCRMQIQVQDQLHMGWFEMCGKYTHGKLHDDSCKRKLEFSFSDNSDMERGRLDSFKQQYIQHNGKYIGM